MTKRRTGRDTCCNGCARLGIDCPKQAQSDCKGDISHLVNYCDACTVCRSYRPRKKSKEPTNVTE
jgi:hypothetical protein